MSMATDRDPSTAGYDWSARVRTTTVEALRYSRFVVADEARPVRLAPS